MATANKIFKDVERFFNEVFNPRLNDGIENYVNREFQKLAEAIRDKVDQRIHVQGRATNGELISSRVKARVRTQGSVYSDTHRAKRAAGGLQTNRVDQEFTGRQREDLAVGEDRGAYEVGFLSQRSADIARHTENYRKLEIWVISDRDIGQVAEEIDEIVFKSLDENLP